MNSEKSFSTVSSISLWSPTSFWFFSLCW